MNLHACEQVTRLLPSPLYVLTTDCQDHGYRQVGFESGYIWTGTDLELMVEDPLFRGSEQASQAQKATFTWENGGNVPEPNCSVIHVSPWAF